MENAELVLVAAPLMGHLIPSIHLANNLISHHPNLSISILVPSLPLPDPLLSSFLRSLPSLPHISLHTLPLPTNLPPNPPKRLSLLLPLLSSLSLPSISPFLTPRTSALILDWLSGTPILHLAHRLSLPSFVFFPSGAAFLHLIFQNLNPLSPLLKNPIPLNVWPAMLLSPETSDHILRTVAEYRSSASGLLVNTFADLEPDRLRELAEDGLPIYSVGPLVDYRVENRTIRDAAVLRWLDEQPKESVVFLCFGSIGSFAREQVEEIAGGIEKSGFRFVWCLRRQPGEGEGVPMPTEYEDLRSAVPEGFMERTEGVGRVIGWAPQAEVLGHEAVGAFVSHCGWNSVLESVWFGVPVVAWPMYAEQQLNAFVVVREVGVAVEVTEREFKYDFSEREANVVVMAEEVERGIRRVMEEEEGVVVRRRVKEMSVLARKALEGGGSSRKALSQFVDDLIKNVRVGSFDDNK